MPRRLGAAAPSIRIGELKLDMRPSWPTFNPSIAPDGDGFHLIARTANYRIGDGVVHDDGMLRNINYLVYVDEHLGVSGIAPIEDHADAVRFRRRSGATRTAASSELTARGSRAPPPAS